MLNPIYSIPSMPPPGVDLETPAILKALALAQTAQSTVELVDGMRDLMANNKQPLVRLITAEDR